MRFADRFSAAALLVALSISGEGVAIGACEPATAMMRPGIEMPEHGGGLNKCGCHFNRKTGECHCHQPRGCGCDCQPAYCKR